MPPKQTATTKMCNYNHNCNCNCQDSSEGNTGFNCHSPEDDNQNEPLQEPAEILKKAARDLFNVYKAKHEQKSKNFKHKKKQFDEATDVFADDIKVAAEKLFNATKDILNSTPNAD